MFFECNSMRKNTVKEKEVVEVNEFVIPLLAKIMVLNQWMVHNKKVPPQPWMYDQKIGKDQWHCDILPLSPQYPNRGIRLQATPNYIDMSFMRDELGRIHDNYAQIDSQVFNLSERLTRAKNLARDYIIAGENNQISKTEAVVLSEKTNEEVKMLTKLHREKNSILNEFDERIETLKAKIKAIETGVLEWHFSLDFSNINLVFELLEETEEDMGDWNEKV